MCYFTLKMYRQNVPVKVGKVNGGVQAGVAAADGLLTFLVIATRAFKPLSNKLAEDIPYSYPSLSLYEKRQTLGA